MDNEIYVRAVASRAEDERRKVRARLRELDRVLWLIGSQEGRWRAWSRSVTNGEEMYFGNAPVLTLEGNNERNLS